MCANRIGPEDLLRSILCFLGACLMPLEGNLRADEKLNFAPNPGFELATDGFTGWYPVGVLSPNTPYGISVVTEVVRSGTHSLRVTPGPAVPAGGVEFLPSHNGDEGRRPADKPGSVRGARTFAMRLEPDVASVVATVWVKKPEKTSASVSLVWTTRKNRNPAVEIGRSRSERPVRSERDWEFYELTAERPHTSDRVQCVVETDAAEPIHMDDVELHFQLKPHVELLVDQLGYEPASATKFVLLQSTAPLPRVEDARLVDVATGGTMAKLQWETLGHLPQWDRYHWRADFSEVRTPGRYRIDFPVANADIHSPEFSIRDNLLTDHTAEAGYRFYHYQRCGCEVPGFHAACHLDDAVLPDGTRRDLTGGWHDAGDYNKYNGLTPEAVRLLAYAWHRKPELLDRWDTDHNSRADILDEALWGARFVRKMLDEERLELLSRVDSGYRYWGPPERETDNQPGTGDERSVRAGAGDLTHCIAGFAFLGRALVVQANRNPAGAVANSADAEVGRELLVLAERLYEKIGGGSDTLIALHAATGKDRYRQLAERRTAELITQQGEGAVVGFRELAEYALAFPGDAQVTHIQQLARRRVAELTKQCDPRFGIVCEADAAGRLIYFRPYANVNDWYVGDTSLRLDAAIDALYAANLGAAGGRSIAERQVHWILGCNPFGISYMEGVGSRFVPGYHHRYNAIDGNPRGAVPGALINGLVRPWPHVDRPWLDLHPEPNADYHSNEPWLLHNNRWLHVLALW